MEAVTGKKICVIVPAHWEAIMGGSQYQAKLLVEGLIARGGYDIHYLCSHVDPDFKPEHYTIVRVAERKGLRRYGYFFDTKRLTSILQGIKPDIIYQRVGCGYTGIAANYASKNGCRMVWHIAHEWDVSPFEWKLARNLPFKLVEKKFVESGIARADRIVAQTERQSELLQANYGRRADAVIPNFHPAPAEDIDKSGPLKVVWVANLKSWKRPELFIRLASDLAHVENVEFIMIGRKFEGEPAYAGIESIVARTPNLTYLGPRSQEEVNELLAGAHVFVNTSRYEGFANTFIQAWMRQVPVVSLDVSADDVLTREGIGFFARGSYERLRDHVVVLVEDRAMLQAMGEKARRYALERHSLDNVDKLVGILRH